MNRADIILIDIGNSALKWALASAHYVHSVPYQTHTVSDLGNQLIQSMGVALGAHLKTIQTIIGCCVAEPSLQDSITHALIHAHAPAAARPEIHWLAAQTQCTGAGLPLRNGYRDPLQLGTDRWHAMLGAQHHAHGHPFVVVQLGTATTLDGVTAEGRHVGGQICPGFTLMRASLAQGTAQLSLATGTPAAFPNCTPDAIARGVTDAQLGAIVQFWQRFINAYAPAHTRPQLLFTGGHAQALAQAWNEAQLNVAATPTILDNLVLQGLRIRAQEFTES